MTADSTHTPDGAKTEKTYEDYIVTLGRADLLRECRRMCFQIASARDAVASLVEAQATGDGVSYAINDIVESLDFDVTAHESDWLTVLDRRQRKLALTTVKGDVA